MIIKIRKSDAKEPFTFVFENADGKVIVRSQNYSQKANAKNGIESVKKNCKDDARYELKEASNGKPFFNVTATNGQIVGTSTLFENEAERTAAIAELKAKSPRAKIVD